MEVDWVGYSTIVQGCLDYYKYEEAIDLLLKAMGQVELPQQERPVWLLYERLNNCLVHHQTEVSVKRFEDVTKILQWLASALGIDEGNKENVLVDTLPLAFDLVNYQQAPGAFGYSKSNYGY